MKEDIASMEAHKKETTATLQDEATGYAERARTELATATAKKPMPESMLSRQQLTTASLRMT